MDDIDEYIAELKAKQEIKDYIEHNIYPERLLSKKTTHLYKPDSLRTMDLLSFPPEKCIDNSEEVIHLQSCIQKCKHIENIIETYQKEDKKDCPICLETIGPMDYFMPTCGHKVCRPCAMKNLFNNKNTGMMCSICREKIF